MFEAFQIGVRISLINGATAGLAALSAQFLKAEGDAARLDARIKGIKSGLIGGASMLAAGVAGAALLKGPYEEAKKLAQAKADFSTLNLAAMDNETAYAKASEIAHQRLGSTITENIKLIQDLHTATGDLPKALALSDVYAQFATAAKMRNGGEPVDSLVMNSIKALEHRGDRVMQHPDVLRRELEEQSKVYFATAGRVNPSDYFHASQTGKMAYSLMGDEFLYGPFAAYMQSRTGNTAGTASMTAMSSLIGGHMTKKAVGFLRDLGLWEDQTSPLLKGMRGNLQDMIAADPELKRLVAANGDLLVQSGGLPAEAAQLYATNPQAFVQKMLIPAIRKKYGDITDEQVAQLLTGQFNRNTSDFLSFWITSNEKAKKDAAIIGKSQDFAGAYQTYLKSPEGAEEAASAAWKNFLALFGTVYLPLITRGLTWLAESLTKVSRFVEAHPLLFKVIADGFILIFGALSFGGLLKIAASGLDGLGLAVKGLKGVATADLATNISNMATGLKAVGLAAAAYVGWQIGSAISDKIDNTKFGDKFSHYNTKYLGAALDFFGIDNDFSLAAKYDGYDQKYNGAKPLPGQPGYVGTGAGSPYIARGNQQTIQVHTTLEVDGRKMAKNVTEHQAKAMSAPQRGTSGFDSTQSPTPIGVSGGW